MPELSLPGSMDRTLPDRLLRWGLPAAALVAAVAAVGMLGQTQVANLSNALAVSIALLSLNVLLGYTGQISLGQAAFVGTGGFLAVQMGGRGVPIIVTVLAAGLGVAVLTAIVGLPSLRIKGLAVAIATLVYGVVAQNYLFQQDWFIGSSAGLSLLAPFGRGAVFRLFLLTVVFLVAVIVIDRQLLATRLGRAFVTVRDGEDRAVAFGVEPGVAKLESYALSGFMAGIAGALIAYQSGVITASEFGVFKSLEYLAITVVGGSGSRSGVLVAGLLLVGLPKLQPPPDARIAPLIGGIALILVVMFLPDGIGGLGKRIGRFVRRQQPAVRAIGAAIAGVVVAGLLVREQTFRDIDSAIVPQGGDPATAAAPEWPLILALLAIAVTVALYAVRSFRVGVVEADEGEIEGALATGEEATERAREAAAHATRLRNVPRGLSLRMPTRVLLEATDVSVRFGGVQALRDISMEVREGEIVGLIGANGAGKSTFYNVVSGFVTPEPGSSILYRGRELLDMRPSQRTEAGIARTFQHMGLLRPETVEDNVLLAQHWLAQYPDFAGVLRLGGTAPTEKELRRRAEMALQIFGLERYRHRQLGALPYGTMRMVELASAVATGADLLFFDEASAGLAPDEAHGLADRFLALRDELGLTLVVIEHHVPLIARVCDYVYCLASGRQLAEGEPASVQSNPDVVAEFLGRSTIGEGGAEIGGRDTGGDATDDAEVGAGADG